jgi:chromosome partitioning protein
MILAVTNQKGGVGKTTTCLNLGAIAAQDGKRTCLIDLDPQANLTKTFAKLTQNHPTAHDLLTRQTMLSETLIDAGQNLSLVPAANTLAGLERAAADDPGLPYRLREKLCSHAEAFDLVIIDTPPTLGALTVSAMTAATHLLIPIQTSYFALHGTNDLLQTYNLIRENLNPNLNLLGVLITLYDPRTTLAREVVEEIRQAFGGKVFGTVIHRCVKLEESPAAMQSVVTYAPKSRAAKEYRQAYRELIARA